MSKQYDPLIIDYAKSADAVSSKSVNELQKAAFDDIDTSYTGAKLQKIDFLSGNDKDDDDMINAVAYIFSYTFKFDNSTWYIAVYAENVKVNDSKEITNQNDVFFRKTSRSESISDVEQELKTDGWSVSQIKVD